MILLKRIRPLIVKEFRQIRRDKRSLGVLLVLPAFLVMLIGYALNFDVKHIAIAVLDQEQSQASREFASAFSNSEYFHWKYSVENYRSVEELLDGGDALVAIVIPSDFSRQAATRTAVAVQVLVDGSNANAATTAISYIEIISQSYSSRLAVKALARVGRKPVIPIEIRPIICYNPSLVSAKFLIPGMIGFILMITGVVSTSLSIVKEKERGTLEQIQMSPLRTVEIILGKTVPYLVIAILASVFVVLSGYFAFDVAIRGSIFWLYAAIIIFLIGALGQGLLISAIAQTQQVAFIASIFSSLLPTFLLSGFVFPVKSMPITLQVISNAAPAKFFLVIVRSIMLKGVGPEAFWDQLLYLALFAASVVTISAIILRKANA